jgi:hypothetical protein
MRKFKQDINHADICNNRLSSIFKNVIGSFSTIVVFLSLEGNKLKYIKK